MSNVNPASEFTGTCTPVKYPCKNGVYFADPCDCHKMYLCDQEKIIERTCSEGTAWNHNDNSCAKDSNVFLDGICNFEKPWGRCNQTDGIVDPIELNKIKVEICNITNGHIPTTTQASGPGSGGNSDSNAGTIAAGIVGGILAILIIMIIVFVVIRKKKGKPLPNSDSIKRYMSRKRKTKLSTVPSLDNPSYHQEEVYTEIDEMGDPTYKGDPNTSPNHLSVSALSHNKASPVLPARALTDTTKQNLSLQQQGDDTVYDNRTEGLRSYVEVVEDSTDGNYKVDEEPKQQVDAQGYLEASNIENGRAVVEDKDLPGYYVLEKGADNSTDSPNSN